MLSITMLYLIMYLLQFPWETLDQIQWKIVTAEPIFFTLANVFGKILLYGYGKTFYHLLCEQNYYLNFLWNCWQKILISIWQKFTISIFARIEKIYVQQYSIKQVNPIFKNQGNQGVRKDILSNGSVMSWEGMQLIFPWDLK